MQQHLWLRRLAWGVSALVLAFVALTGALSLMPRREVTFGIVSASAVPLRAWGLRTKTGFNFVYHPGRAFSRTAYETHEFQCGPLYVSIRGRPIPDMWL